MNLFFVGRIQKKKEQTKTRVILLNDISGRYDLICKQKNQNQLY